MTNAQEQDVFQAAKTRPQGTKRSKPVSGVTNETFWPLGKSFMAAAGGGFVIIRDIAWATTEFPHTPREWGAWMSYLRAKRIPVVVFEQKGKATVPAQWPHLFDADWRETIDKHSADKYQAKTAEEVRSAAAFVDGLSKKHAVMKRLGYDPSKTKGIARFEESPEEPPRFIDKDALFADYEKDMAEVQARRQARQEG